MEGHRGDPILGFNLSVAPGSTRLETMKETKIRQGRSTRKSEKDRVWSVKEGIPEK